MSSEPVPVIIGSGLSGCLISLRLSEEKIPHIMVGDLPNEKPRLGESLNMVSTVGLHRYVDQLQDTLFEKSIVRVYRDGREVNCPTTAMRRWTGRFWLRLLGWQSPPNMYHVDRIMSDKKIFEFATQNACCHFIQDHVVKLNYDKPSDTIISIELSKGTHLSPQVVFDATNQFAVLPKALEIEKLQLGGHQRLISAHFYAATSSPTLHADNWQHTTHQIHLRRETDGVNGQAWVIFCGRYLSVGATFPADEVAEQSDDRLWECVAEACERHGLNYRDVFPNKVDGLHIQFQHYRYHKAYGRNWMLAGSTLMSLYWTSGVGVATLISSALAAPQFIKNPQKIGRAYENTMRHLLVNQEIHSRLFYKYDNHMGIADILAIGDQLITSNIQQLNRATKFSRQWRHRIAASILERIFPNKLLNIRDFCYADDGTRLSQVQSVQ